MAIDPTTGQLERDGSNPLRTAISCEREDCSGVPHYWGERTVVTKGRVTKTKGFMCKRCVLENDHGLWPMFCQGDCDPEDPVMWLPLETILQMAGQEPNCPWCGVATGIPYGAKIATEETEEPSK